MLDQVRAIAAEAHRHLAQATTEQELELWRTRFLGRKGALNELLRGLGTLPADQRPVVGAEANRLKRELEAAFEQRREALVARARAAALEADRVDITLPGRPPVIGTLHPTTQMIRRITEIFASLGFDIVTGPEVEWDYYNFEALNIPPGHPARDQWDTFWITPEDSERPMLLRTHTSPMQVRIMEKQKPPVRVVVPGRVYRYEATDATHESVFHQFEGLAVDEGVTMADLNGTIYTFARRMFGERRRIRFRCDFFPFVEPGVDVAVDCWVCEGAGCTLCRRSGWIEVMGAGMVHPRVLEYAGIDPRRYTGFAFGGGVERFSMLLHRIDDIRLFYGNDIRFLRQFVA
ncbi:MAG: phenylalanine--tRNA ligase subunit alpha [Chloroflexi bacterium]|nr:phenylalanine--tRNA ligase subunit alpha [Chloroflexota bacterium]